MKITYIHLTICIALIACILLPILTNAQQLADRIGNVTTPAFGKIQDRDGNVVGFAYSTPEGDATLTDLDFQPIDNFSIPCPDLRTSLEVLDLGATTPLGRYVITTTCDDRYSSVGTGERTVFFRDGGATIDSAMSTRHRLLVHGGRSYVEFDAGQSTRIVDLNTYDTLFTYSSFNSFDPVMLATGPVFVQERNNDYAILDLDFAFTNSFSEGILEADTLTRFDGGKISPVDILADGKVDFFGSGLIMVNGAEEYYNYVISQEGTLLTGSDVTTNRPFYADPSWSSDYLLRGQNNSLVQEIYTVADGSLNFASPAGVAYERGINNGMPVLFSDDGSDVTLLSPTDASTQVTLPSGIVVGNSRYLLQGLTDLGSSSATAFYRGFNANSDQEFVLAANDQLLWAFEGLGDVEFIEPQGDSVRIVVRAVRGSDLSDYEVNVYKLSSQPSSVSEITMDNQFVAFPNPTNDVLQLSHPDLAPGTAGILNMIDITGRNHNLGAVQLGQTFNTSSLPAGMYAVDLRLENGKRYVTRVVIR